MLVDDIPAGGKDSEAPEAIEMRQMDQDEQDAAESTAPLIQREPNHAQHNHASEGFGGYDRRFVWSLTLSAGVSGLLFGYDTGVISSMLVAMGTDLSHRPLDTLDKSLITSCTSLFALIASPIAGSMADRLGRKRVILFADLLFALGALWQAFTSHVWGMIVGRSIVGLAIGGASLVAPLYISELAPSVMRGRLVTTTILFVTGGQVVAYLVGWALSTLPSGWRWMVGLGALPAIFQICFLLYMPESPRWLVKVDRHEAARATLSNIYRHRGDDEHPMVESILKAIAHEHLAQEATKPSEQSDAFFASGIAELESLLFIGSHRRALTIACLLQGLQQLCGFNSLMYFSATLFQSLSFSSPTLTSLSIAMTNFIFTLAAFYLIDRVGRRRILLYSIPFMFVALLLCAGAYTVLGQSTEGDPSRGQGVKSPALAILASLVLYCAAYALGLGNVPWQQSELFPLGVRSVGSAIATSTNWSSNFLIGLTFLPMMEFITPGWTFVCYAAVCAIGWVCIWAIYPETMGLDLEDVGALLKDGYGVKESLRRRDQPDPQ